MSRTEAGRVFQTRFQAMLKDRSLIAKWQVYIVSIALMNMHNVYVHAAIYCGP